MTRSVPLTMKVPLLGHERDLAEVDLLLLDVLDRAGAALRIDVPDDELDGDLERRGEGHAALVALVDVVLRLAERVAHELERGRLVEVLDREDRLEDGLQAQVLARLGRRRPRCRNSSYDRFWISIRFGMSMIFLIRPNVRRKRRLFATAGHLSMTVIAVIDVLP